MLASARGEVKGFTRRVALLEGELADVLQARDTTKANFYDLSVVATDVDRRQEDAERECRELV
jgi:hypothetical protein